MRIKTAIFLIVISLNKKPKILVSLLCFFIFFYFSNLQCSGWACENLDLKYTEEKCGWNSLQSNVYISQRHLPTWCSKPIFQKPLFKCGGWEGVLGGKWGSEMGRNSQTCHYFELAQVNIWKCEMDFRYPGTINPPSNPFLFYKLFFVWSLRLLLSSSPQFLSFLIRDSPLAYHRGGAHSTQTLRAMKSVVYSLPGTTVCL